jgi:cytochrome c553
MGYIRKQFHRWFSWRPRRIHLQMRRSTVWVWVVVLILCSFWGTLLAQGQVPVPAQTSSSANTSLVGTVDAVPPTLQFAQETYLERCATCHIGIPPAVLPTVSWKEILEEDSNHYGAPWAPLQNPELGLIWRYTRTFSGPLNEDETVPYRIERSRYFKILHPRVKFSEPVNLGTCVSCHPSAAQFNFRKLSSQWQDAP